MSINSSSSNDSLLHPHLSSINSSILFDMYCLTTRPSSLIFTAFYITYIFLLLPLCILILYPGLQRWRQQHSTSAAAITSHSDSFTYHLVTMELIGVLGSILCCCGINRDHYNILSVGLCLWGFTCYGEMFFHLLTFLERYLAVVHPITYLSLRREKGIRIRNISIGAVWLLCFGGGCLMNLGKAVIIVNFCLVIVSLIIISFCSLSVLCVLIHPGPGEQGGHRKRVDQSKQRAFYTIMATLGVLLLRWVANLIWVVLKVLEESHECVMMSSGLWFNLPTSLVLLLQFLHRAGT